MELQYIAPLNQQIDEIDAQRLLIEDVIADKSNKYGVDSSIISSMVEQESNWNPNATSEAGAQGLMQIMPKTFKSLGGKNPYDIEENIELGTKYFAQLLKWAKGDIEKALKAYNAGMGNVASGKADKFPETKQYVSKVMGKLEPEFISPLGEESLTKPLYTIGNPKGLLEQGNIDLNNRPVVHNPDGTISTELSFSIEEDGREVLIPQVVNGKIVSRKEAIAHYQKTHEHMGIFDTPENADIYAELAHNRPVFVSPLEEGATEGVMESIEGKIAEKAGQAWETWKRGFAEAKSIWTEGYNKLFGKNLKLTPQQQQAQEEEALRDVMKFITEPFFEREAVDLDKPYFENVKAGLRNTLKAVIETPFLIAKFPIGIGQQVIGEPLEKWISGESGFTKEAYQGAKGVVKGLVEMVVSGIPGLDPHWAENLFMNPDTVAFGKELAIRAGKGTIKTTQGVVKLAKEFKAVGKKVPDLPLDIQAQQEKLGKAEGVTGMTEPPTAKINGLTYDQVITKLFEGKDIVPDVAEALKKNKIEEFKHNIKTRILEKMADMSKEERQKIKGVSKSFEEQVAKAHDVEAETVIEEPILKPTEAKEVKPKPIQPDLIGAKAGLEGKIPAKEAEITPLEKATTEAKERAFIEEKQIPIPEKPEITFKISDRAKKRGYVKVTVDVAKLDESFKKDKNFYVGAGGKGEMIGRRESFNQYLINVKTGETIETPEVTLKRNGEVAFTDGRHRFSVIRDMGYETIDLAVPKNQVKLFQQKFGVEKEVTIEPKKVKKPSQPTTFRTWVKSIGGISVEKEFWNKELDTAITENPEIAKAGLLNKSGGGKTLDEIALLAQETQWKIEQSPQAVLDAIVANKLRPDLAEAKVERELEKRAINERTLKSPTLAEIQGEEGFIGRSKTESKYDLREKVKEKDILPTSEWIMSPEFIAKDYPIAREITTKTVEAGQRYAYQHEAEKLLFDEVRQNLSKQEQIAVTKALRRQAAATTEKIRNASQRIRDYFDDMTERVKAYKRIMYKKYLSAKEIEAVDRVLEGEEAIAVAEELKLDADTIKEIVKEYKDIDNWGIDDYVTNIEKGSYRFVDENGTTRVVGVSKKHAIEKAQDFLERNPDIKTLWLDTEFAAGREFPTLLTRGQYLKLKRRLQGEFAEDAKTIQDILHKRGSLVSIKPTQKFAGAMQKRYGVLEGEKNIFDVLSAYSYMLNKKMELDPVLADARMNLGKLPKNLREAMENYLTDVKGRKTIGDRAVDEIFERIGVGLKPFLLSRSVQKIRTGTTWLKLGYRPIAGLVNLASGMGHIWVKTGSTYMAKGAYFLRTNKGKQFIKEETKYLGLSFAMEAARLKEMKTPMYHPLGMFQRAEPWNRKMAIATNYIYAKEKLGMSENAARAFARRGNRFQQFLYDISSLPRLMRSPTGKLILQFKPYLVKELEFISTLRGVEIPRYIGLQLSLGGVRGLIYTLKSLPVLSALGLLDDVEDWLNRNFPRLSRGIGGFFGVDVSPAVTFQFPNTMEEWAGVFLGDAIKLYKNVFAPYLEGEKYLGREMENWLKGTAPAFYYWDMLIDSVMDEDGWVKNDRGQRIFKPTGWDKFKMLMGARPLELSVERLSEREIRREEQIERNSKQRLVDNIIDAIQNNKKLSGDVWRDAMYYGMFKIDKDGYIDFEPSFYKTLENRYLTPKVRLFFRVSKKNRSKVIERMFKKEEK